MAATAIEELKSVAEFSRDFLDDGARTVELRSVPDPVTIKLAAVRDIPVVLDIIQTLMQRFGITKLGALPSVEFGDPQVFVPLVAEFSDKIFDLAARMSSLTKEDLLDLPLDDGLKVVRKLFAVNKSFFLLEVIPIFMSITEALEDENRQEG